MLLIKFLRKIKDALVAWYSPVKQKLSNYDVIESYIIDFTTFNNRDDAIINNNKFVFTGHVVVGINYERIQVEKYNSYKILIKGLTGGVYYYYRNVDGVENYIIFNKDEVYNKLSGELQMLIQEELINSVKDKVANSPRGKELLEKQLNNIRTKKDSIIEEANRELELFKKFQIAAQANPKLTYVEFCKTINNE